MGGNDDDDKTARQPTKTQRHINTKEIINFLIKNKFKFGINCEKN